MGPACVEPGQIRDVLLGTKLKKGEGGANGGEIRKLVWAPCWLQRLVLVSTGVEWALPRGYNPCVSATEAFTIGSSRRMIKNPRQEAP